MAGNLSRNEAVERARLLVVDSYTVRIDLTRGDEHFGSDTVVRFRCTEPGESTFIDLSGAQIHKAVLNGIRLSEDAYDAERGRLTLAGLAADNELQVFADCLYSGSGEGLHRVVDPVDGEVYLHTQFQTADAQRVFACFDQPNLKATFDLTMTTPDHWLVVSNGLPEPAEPTTGIWHFPADRRLPTYLVVFVAGPFHHVHDELDGIPLGLYCRTSLSKHLDAEHLFRVTRQGMDFLQREFGIPYPFRKYDQVFVPGIKVGAMENAGCVTYYEKFLPRSRVTDAELELRASVMLHEMSHMWFGDLVTMRWWDGLWLNESFATYAGTTALAGATAWGDNAWATFADADKGWAYGQDQLPTTHPIAASIPDLASAEVNFDGITYAKGASVLKQLAAWVGHDRFLAGVRAYFARHAWDNAELSDFLAALQEASGRNLNDWSKEWLQTSGVNTLAAAFRTDEAGRFTEFSVLQEGAPLRSHRLAIGLYDRTEEGRLVRRRRIDLDISGEQTPVDALAGEQQPDLILLNDDDLTYAKVRLDPRSLATVLSGGLAGFTSALPRVLCRTAMWELTRDAELSARRYLRHVVAELPTITDIGITESMIQQAIVALHEYTDETCRKDARAELVEELHRLAHAAEPGSDHQLAYVNALTALVSPDTNLTLLRSLLDTPEALPGLTVDVDLRWRLLAAMAACGAADATEIEAELTRDQTASGEQQAAACRAAIPSIQAKAAAWADITSGQVAGTAVRELIAGLMSPAHRSMLQRQLLQPYVTKYFDEVGRLWSALPPDVAQQFTKGCYPRAFPSEAVLTQTESYTAARDTPEPLRRLLLEGADDVRRALRAQAADRASESTSRQLAD